MNTVIAIDGPAAAGKSTVARRLSRELDYLYVDSGALYRTVTLDVLRQGIDSENVDAVSERVASLNLTFRIENNAVICTLDGEAPGDAIRAPEVNRHVSPVSKVPAVRLRVTERLRQMRELGNLVVEGRDIGSVVFPDANARFYLDASPDERARRRHKEDVARGIDVGADSVRDSLLNRDRIDSSRATAPLTIPAGAVVIDTTALDIEGVLSAIRVHLE